MHYQSEKERKNCALGSETTGGLGGTIDKRGDMRAESIYL